MPVLVTGGCGFVGAHVVKRIVASGEDVVAFDSNATPELLDGVLTPSERTRVTIEAGDLLDMPKLMRLTHGRSIDRVVHLAYMISVSTRANPWLAQKVNIEGTNNIFELGISGRVSRIAWASTIDVYGPRSVAADGVVYADAPYDPTNTYGACKMLNEVSAQDYRKMFGLDAMALRLPAVYGPGTTRSWTRFIPELIKSLVETGAGKAPSVPTVMPWAYVDDIAEAFALALDAPANDERAITLAAPYAAVADIVGQIQAAFPDGQIALEEYPGQGTVPNYDGSKAETLLGWKPRTGIADGIARIAAYYRARR